MAFSAGVAVSPYILGLNTSSSQLGLTNTLTLPITSTTPVQPLSASSTSTSAYSTAASQTQSSLAQKSKWISSSSIVISWSQAASYSGQSKTVEGTIVYTFVSSKGNVFLDFHNPYQGYFSVIIFSSSVGNFKFQPASFYLNKEVRITGLIQMYQGAPEIIVNTPSQIEVANMGFNYP
jgi:DNA/RNA endonuclease YhcR with UshA esterase domain